jgi:hypothetical protein
MLKSSVMPECSAGLLIRLQPNTYIEKTEHFPTSWHLVKERGQLNKGYNLQEVSEIQPSFTGVTVLSLGYTTNCIGRTSLQAGLSSRHL